MKRFWDLLEKSIIVQGTVTLAMTAVLIQQIITTGDVSKTLLSIISLIYGFWFGTMSQKSTGAIVRDEMQKMSGGR